MPDVEWSDHGKTEYLMCFTYEPERKDKCCGASGRKLRQCCIYCPNWIRHNEKEGRQDNEKDHGNPGGNRRSGGKFLLRTATDHVGADRGDDD